MHFFRFYVSFNVYSYTFSPESATQTNFGNNIIILPGNVGTAVLIVVCYALVLVKLRKNRHAVAGSTRSTQAGP